MRFRTSWLLTAVGTMTVGNHFFQSGHNGTSNPPSTRSPRGRW
jgi:hypothetical protein